MQPVVIPIRVQNLIEIEVLEDTLKSGNRNLVRIIRIIRTTASPKIR